MKKLGPSFNEIVLMGRIVGDPVVAGGWATATLRTEVPEPGDGGGWNPVQIDVPIMTNDAKRIKTIQDFVKDERQLFLKGYLKYWNDAQGVKQSSVVVTLIKLMSKTMFDDSPGGQQVPPLQ